jgi:mRNA interferase HigB
MVVISYGTLRDLYKKYPDSKDALNNWYRFVIAAGWSNYHAMKKMYNSVDAAGSDR